jgi:hypothetical protein
MDHIPSAAIFKKNNAVIYYGQGRPQRMYMGGKTGGYRTLSSVKGSDSGVCVLIDEMARQVFPAPNESGVFVDEVCNAIEYRLDHNFHVEIQYVQWSPTNWSIASSISVGNSGFSSLPSKSRSYPSLSAAMQTYLPPLLQRLAALAAGVGRDIEFNVTKSGQAKAKRFGREALYLILGALPRELSNDILKLLMVKSESSNG